MATTSGGGGGLSLESTSKDPRVEELIKKLEEICERIQEDKSLSTIRQDMPSSAHFPLRVREIIQETLSPAVWSGQPFLASSLSRENSKLLQELDKAQSQLSQSRKECHDLGMKLISLSEKVEMLPGLEKSVEDLRAEKKHLSDEVAHLRETLAAKDEAHELHLRAYQDTHERQEEQLTLLEARLTDYQEKYLETDKMLREKEVGFLSAKDNAEIITKLQAKVTSLEKELREASQPKGDGAVKPAPVNVHGVMEQQKVVELAVGNQKLREQLRECQETNQRLVEDIHELTFRWRESLAKLDEKEKDWEEKLERQSIKSAQFNQANLSTVARDVAEMKTKFHDTVSSVHKELGASQDKIKSTSEQLSVRVEEETRELKNLNEMLMLELQQKEEDLAKISTELKDMTVKHEALSTKHQLIVSSYEEHLGSLGTSLKQAKDKGEENMQMIENLESSKAQLEYGKSNLSEQLLVTEMNLSQMQSDMAILKACIDSIVGVFSPPNTQLPDPSHQHQQRLHLQPKHYDTGEDVKRTRDWAVSVVECGVNTRDETIKSLKSEVVALQTGLERQEQRMEEVELECKAHSASNKALKEELSTSKEKLGELMKIKKELEKQVEDTSSKKLEMEHTLAQSMARMSALTQDREKLQKNNMMLQDSVNNMKYELEKVKDEKQTQEMDLTSKHNATKKLEQQFQTVEEEAKVLRDRIAELEGIKYDLERKISETNIMTTSVQMEKESLMQELKSVRDSEATAVITLEEMKVINRKLEGDKRQLLKSLREVSDRKGKLDQENVDLEKLRVENEDELQKLKVVNTQLIDQVGQLDKSLDESEGLRGEVQNERDSLSLEVSALSEALGKTKLALEEVQVQRGKLNNVIAQMAQEKGELIRDKVNSNSELTKMQGNLKMSEERCSSLEVVKERLEVRVKELESRMIAYEQSERELSKAILTLKQEKQDLLTEKDKQLREKDREMSEKVGKKDAELQQTFAQIKTIEGEFRANMQQQKSAAEQKMMRMKESHDNEITSLSEQLQDLEVQLKEEIHVITETSRAETERLRREKELFTAQMKEEKLLLEKRLEKTQRMFEEKCEEMRSQYENFTHMVAEQKAQLESSNLNARRLESELTSAEHRIEKLQHKLDEVKVEAVTQTESLKSKLKEATQHVLQLEASHRDSSMTAKNLEGQRDTLQRQTAEVQRELDSAMRQKSALKSSCREFQQKLITAETELARVNESNKIISEKLRKVEGTLIAAEKDAESAHATLTKVENLHAKLVSDHAAVQAQLTTSEKEKNTYQLELQSAEDRIIFLERQKDEIINNITTIENKLKVANKAVQAKQREAAAFRQRAANLERERNDLNLNLYKVQESLHMQGQVDAATRSELQAQVSELKSIRDSLKEEINSLKISLATTKDEVSANEKKLSISSGRATSLATELKQSQSLRRELQSKYSELMAVVTGTLGLKESRGNLGMSSISSPSKEVRFSHSQTESGMGDSLPTSFHSSFFGGGMDEIHTSSSSREVPGSIDISAVRERILSLQKKQSVLDRANSDAMVSVSSLEKKIGRLENEKMALESRLETLRSSLSTLQGKYDATSRERNTAEVTVSVQKKSIEALEQSKHQLEVEVNRLRQQVEAHLTGKRECDIRINRLASSQAGSEANCKQHEMHIMELQLQNKQKDETILKQKSLISMLQSSRETREAEILNLQQKLATNQQSVRVAETQLKNINEDIKDVDTSLKMSQRRESILLDKIKKLETDLIDAQNQKASLGLKFDDLGRELAEMKREHNAVERRLSMLTQNQLSSDAERTKLQDTIHRLETSFSGERKDKAEVVSKMKRMEAKIQQREEENRTMAMKITMLTNDKEQLSSHIKQIEEDMETAVKGKQIANELCSSLESEKEMLRNELEQVRGENKYLKSELREASFQSERMDVLMASQQKQRTELDQTLQHTSKENMELMKSLRELRMSASEKEKKSFEKVENLSHEVTQLQSSMMLKEASWSGREQSYRKTINDLEVKVQLLENKLDDYKRRKIEFLEKARQHEKTIQAIHTPLRQYETTHRGDGMGFSPSLSSPSPICPRGSSCRVFSPSPTLPMSGSSGSGKDGSRYPIRKYGPVTSTPNSTIKF